MNGNRKRWIWLPVNQFIYSTKLHLRGFSKKKENFDWASGIDHPKTADQTTASFNATTELKRHSSVSRCRNSSSRSASSEHRDVSSRVGIQYTSGFSDSSNIPIMELIISDGNRLKCLECSCMIIATVDHRQIVDFGRTSHLKFYRAGQQCEQNLERVITDNSMVLPGAFCRGNLEGFMSSSTHRWSLKKLEGKRISCLSFCH